MTTLMNTNCQLRTNHATRWIRVVVVFLVMAFAGRAVGGDGVDLKGYVVFPITTELQRALLFSTRADAYAQIDVDGVVHDGKFDAARFDKEGFGTDLAVLRKQIGSAKPSLKFYFRYASVALDPKQTEAMENAITALARQAGFAKVGTGMNGEGEKWQDKVQRLAGLVDDVEQAESPIEDEFLRAYPVRTRLARYLLGDADYDCFIELRQPIDGRFDEFSYAQRQAIAQRVAELTLPQKRKLTFRCVTTKSGRAIADRYFGLQNGKPALVDPFVKQLGFQSSTFSITPMSVSPEDLLGKQAPDFTLEGLDGGKLHLQEAIRGRVAVIAFWGVACGGCRIEAPHLTALHNQYGEHGLAVVAVNGYDESKETVGQYVRAAGLTHPIALMGKTVAEQQYTVASYPVTYLVDRRGTIVDYHLGFEPGDEKLLATRVARLLAERETGGDGK